MIAITVLDLLSMPRACHPSSPPALGMPGFGTQILLPDDESTFTVTTWTDERWRAWNHKVINVRGTLTGPAARLDGRGLFALIPGCRSFQRGARPGGRELGFHQDTTLTALRALPHSCGAQPGQRCDLPPYVRRCIAPTTTAVPA
ncbi:hypothetical protein [Actinoplanes derwentensis]|uniref:Uncharacterized protein n=1 Tax=Actinoplanes derwentensis TaxID=113562 RepID=A0A1H2CVH2_9ACTN|nr:hypothetical protein [Actinoplanes derwentensis]GID81958.1 hypothetical protein Ade03nite_08820 [Actinoplanes derwentensis]SDT74202.1 hypothetical protein SAMN04489716_6907 [Actinoplanes derwentensis]